MEYQVSKDDPIHMEHMQTALDEARKCVPVKSAFCVGCAIAVPLSTLPSDLQNASFIPHGQGAKSIVMATGYSRELEGNTHAEANALAKLIGRYGNVEAINVKELLKAADVYTTMEPCSVRLSGLEPCSKALIEAGVKRCFIGVGEPDDFVKCEGARMMEEAGIEVIWTKGLEEQCLKVARMGRDE
ncbi:hypothetical protein FRC03_009658 [Tulasnella sp. 419]|nr:hypothetical protein FRC03_009658 [Tulasnella sp. 419]